MHENDVWSGTFLWYQKSCFYTELARLNSWITIEKFEAQTSEAIIHADFKNAIYLFLTTTGWTWGQILWGRPQFFPNRQCFNLAGALVG